MDDYEYQQLGEWAKSFYSSNSKDYKNACEAFSRIPVISEDVDLGIEGLEEIVYKLPVKIAEKLYHTYLEEKNNYILSQSKEYDKKAKSIINSFNYLLDNGIKSSYMRNTGAHAIDFENAKSQLYSLVRENNPRRHFSSVLISPSNLSKRKQYEDEYYPSYEVESLIEKRETFSVDKQFHIIGSIDEIVKIDKEMQLNADIMRLIGEMEFDSFKDKVFPKTIGSLMTIYEDLKDRNERLKKIKNKKIDNLNKAIAKFEKKKPYQQEDEKDLDSEEIDFDIRHNVSLEKVQGGPPLTDMEISQIIESYLSKIVDLKEKQLQLEETKRFKSNGAPLEDNLPTSQVTEYKVITDESLYDQYQSLIELYEKRIKELEEARIREEREHDFSLAMELDEKNEAWENAYERFKKLSLFRRVITSISGKHPKKLNNQGDLSIDEVERLYR
jgi:hypothetical protein